MRPQAVYEGAGDALGELDPAAMEIEHSLALISSTNTVSDRLPNWADFVRRTHEHYLKTRPDQADALLEGFL